MMNKKLSQEPLSVTHPQLAIEWHPTENGILTPDMVVAGSNRKVVWRCSTNASHVWTTTICNRAKRGDGCRKCSGRVVTEETSLMILYPHLVEEWHPTQNGQRTPRNVSPGSDYKAWWRCRKDPSHEWPARIQQRVTQHIGCPFCSGRYATPKNSLKALYPHLVEEWHPTENGELTADQVKSKSDKIIVWQCRTDITHVWRATVKSRVKGDGCPMCSNRRVTSSNSLQALFPEIAAQWHSELNAPLTPSDVVPGSERKVWWCCPKNPLHVWNAIIRNRAVLKSGCLFCSGQMATLETSLQAKRPDIAAEWHPIHNKDISPENVLPKSNKKIWWQCQKDPLHEWQATINSRTSGCGCPVCAGQVATSATSLRATYPDLAVEWHPTANTPLTPDKVLPGSGLSVRWKCKKDSSHEWDARIQHRANGIGCPFCSGQRATPATSLLAHHPDLAAQWHPTRNASLTPNQVKPRSNLSVWWICPRNPLHEWESVIDNRVTSGSGCPQCRPAIGSSKEDMFARILDEHGIAYQRQKGIGRYRVDFYLVASHTVVEIQGCFWHGCLECGFNDEYHQIKREQDAKRNSFIQKKGHAVEEIWEHEFREVESINAIVATKYKNER